MPRLLLAIALLAPLPCRADAPGATFVDPSEQELPATVPAERVPPHVSSMPASAMDPPRRGGQWEIATSVLAWIPVSADGAGGLARAHALYRFDVPMMVRADLLPLGFSFADDGRGAGAFGLLSLGFDHQVIGLSVGVGAASNNEHDQVIPSVPRPGEPAPLFVPGPGAMTAIVLGIRVGVADGLAFWLRSGIAIDHQSLGSKFAIFEGWGQVPFGPQWALTLRGSWTMAGTADLLVGMRVWLEGRGGPGSIALRLSGGFVRLTYQPPSRGRGYPDDIDHLGPGLGIGIEGRL